MVHAKLAVIATKAADLCNKVDQLTEEHRQLWDLSTRHSARLDAQQLQLAQLVNHFRKD